MTTTMNTIGSPVGRRLRLLGLAAVAACLLVGVLGVASASATLVREGSFGSLGQGAGQIGREEFGDTLAVDQTTGDVYVADKGNNRIDKFDASGKFLMAWGYGVANGTTKAMQTCTTTCFNGIAGTGPGQLDEASAIAVDSSGGMTDGDVYVVNGTGRYPSPVVILKFSSEGVFLGENNGSASPEGFAVKGQIAVDGSGNLWVAHYNGIYEFDPSGAYITDLTDEGKIHGAENITVDSAHQGGQAYYIPSQGYERAFMVPLVGSAPPAAVDGGGEGRDRRLALDPVTGRLYILRQHEGGELYTVLVYDDAHTLLETVNTQIEEESSAMAFGHSAGMLYMQVESGQVVFFKEYIPGPPLVMSESTSLVRKSSARLQAKLNPLGGATTYHFEYGTSAAYSASTPESAPVGSDFKPYDVSFDAGELQAGTVYHFRVVATNPDGTTYGPDETFRTSSGFFSFLSFDGMATNPDGSFDTQAGSHPDAFTVRYRLNVTHDAENHELVEGGIAKDIEVDLPPGFVGNPTAVPQCSLSDFLANSISRTECPDDTAVGLIRLYFGGITGVFPLYNLAPPPGTVAEFGFPVLTVNITMTVSVRTGGDNGLHVVLHNLPQALQISGADTTFWGVPEDSSHDRMRGHCLEGSGQTVPGSDCHSDIPAKAFLTLPSLCSAPLTTTIRADSWGKVGSFVSDSFTTHDEAGGPLPFTGCERLGFEPSLSVAPDTSHADTPAGLTVHLKVDQSGLLSKTGIAPSDIQNTEVSLPEGVVINPGQAAGLVACQPGEDGIGTESKPSCPAASKVGSVVITTPLLPDKLEGPVYILPSDPPHLRLLVAPSGDSINLKLIGDVYLDPVTGRLTSKFEGTPPLPFTDLQLSFSGGAQAALATPAKCGVYSTVFDFTPWSSPFGPDVRGSDSFAIDSGPGGSACMSPLSFAPSMIAGSTTDQAAGFTDFSLLLQRGDGQQRIAGLQFKTPPGLLGMIRGVTLCGSGEAASGDCPANSQIGHVVVGAGPGPYPLYVPEAGRPPAPIYLTGPYKGAPYGLSIVVPVVTGPFDLGRIVVRSAISVDPHTSQLTVSTDPLPTIVDGVPVDLRTIDTVIDRPGFMFNPTSCAPMAFSGIASSVEGSTAPISTHFQVGSCQTLKFKPDFRVSTNGHTSRRNGASLDARIVYPTVAPGNNQASAQSNIAKVKVDLPRQLPSRLTTLQKACPDSVFESNPDNCPKASRVGYAKAVTPVLPGQLSGPAYFVSHGGAAFPDLIVVLQGQGVRVDLVGSTFIGKQGITSSTFQSVPDVPIYTFELYLPQGRDSALAANGNLCKSTLRMPTMFQAQDGQVIHQNTPIAVTGCERKARHARKGQKGTGARHASTGRGASGASRAGNRQGNGGKG